MDLDQVHVSDEVRQLFSPTNQFVAVQILPDPHSLLHEFLDHNLLVPLKRTELLLKYFQNLIRFLVHIPCSIRAPNALASPAEQYKRPCLKSLFNC